MVTIVHELSMLALKNATYIQQERLKFIEPSQADQKNNIELMKHKL